MIKVEFKGEVEKITLPEKERARQVRDLVHKHHLTPCYTVNVYVTDIVTIVSARGTLITDLSLRNAKRSFGIERKPPAGRNATGHELPSGSYRPWWEREQS